MTVRFFYAASFERGSRTTFGDRSPTSRALGIRRASPLFESGGCCSSQACHARRRKWIAGLGAAARVLSRPDTEIGSALRTERYSALLPNASTAVAVEVEPFARPLADGRPARGGLCHQRFRATAVARRFWPLQRREFRLEAEQPAWACSPDATPVFGGRRQLAIAAIDRQPGCLAR